MNKVSLRKQFKVIRNEAIRNSYSHGLARNIRPLLASLIGSNDIVGTYWPTSSEIVPP